MKGDLVVGLYKDSIICLKSRYYDNPMVTAWHWGVISGSKLTRTLENSEVLVFSNRCNDHLEALAIYGDVKNKEE